VDEGGATESTGLARIPGEIIVNISARLIPLPLIAALGACATVPSGPSVAVLPAPTKNFEQFRDDDAICRHYAETSAGYAGQAGTDSAARSAAVGTVLGAITGALIGAASGNPGSGAAIGAGGGLIVGSAYGTDAYRWSANAVQDRYDIAYMQCMYTKGNQVPMPAEYRMSLSDYQSPPPASEGSDYPPPPPPGPPPAPPPDAR
jgi:hypothetical protein